MKQSLPHLKSTQREKENKNQNPLSSPQTLYPTSLYTGCPSIYWMSSSLRWPKGRIELLVQETTAVVSKVQIIPLRTILLLFQAEVLAVLP